MLTSLIFHFLVYKMKKNNIKICHDSVEDRLVKSLNAADILLVTQ